MSETNTKCSGYESMNGLPLCKNSAQCPRARECTWAEYLPNGDNPRGDINVEGLQSNDRIRSY